jgi:uncharacterized protein YjaG (DUF416 family)
MKNMPNKNLLKILQYIDWQQLFCHSEICNVMEKNNFLLFCTISEKINKSIYEKDATYIMTAVKLEYLRSCKSSFWYKGQSSVTFF